MRVGHIDRYSPVARLRQESPSRVEERRERERAQARARMEEARRREERVVRERGRRVDTEA